MKESERNIRVRGAAINKAGNFRFASLRCCCGATGMQRGKTNRVGADIIHWPRLSPGRGQRYPGLHALVARRVSSTFFSNRAKVSRAGINSDGLVSPLPRDVTQLGWRNCTWTRIIWEWKTSKWKIYCDEVIEPRNGDNFGNDICKYIVSNWGYLERRALGDEKWSFL